MTGARDKTIRVPRGRRRPRGRRSWLVVLTAAAACVGCAQTSTTGPQQGHSLRARSALRAGAGLYEAGEFVRAARAFEQAALLASGERALRRNATAAECTAWLRARHLAELGDCTTRLQALERRERHSDPGVNTLIAMGALAAQRPPPPYKIPAEVESVLRAADDEARR